MIIRKAEQKDLPEIVDLIMSFYAEGLHKSGLSFDRESLLQTAGLIAESHIMLVAENGTVQGVIAGIVSNSMFDYSQKVVEEKIWFISREYRGKGAAIRLFKTFEKTAKELGASLIMMVHMADVMPGKVKKIYSSFGYREIESHYIKPLGD